MQAIGDRPSHRAHCPLQRCSRPLVLTPQRRAILAGIGRCGLSTAPQLALLLSLSEKTVRRQALRLGQAELIEIIRLPRVVLAEPDQILSGACVFGSGPNGYAASRAGLEALQELGLAEGVQIFRQPRSPGGLLYLRHSLEVAAAYIAFARSAGHHTGHAIASWRAGAAAEIDLQRPRPPRVVRPDARLIYRVDERFLVGLVELDRATERGSRRWAEKLTAYRLLFESERLREVTGYVNARVLIITPDNRRRDQLAEFIVREAPAGLSARCWLTDRTFLNQPDTGAALWRRPADPTLIPLLPRHLSSEAGDPG